MSVRALRALAVRRLLALRREGKPITRHLGSAYLSNRASGEQIREMKRARAREADRLRRLLAVAEKDRATRYAAATRGTPAEVLGTVSELEAEAARRAASAADLTQEALPGYLPLAVQVPDSWVAPRSGASCGGRPEPVPANPSETNDESTPAPR